MCLLFIAEKFTVDRMSNIDLWFDGLHFKCNFTPFINKNFDFGHSKINPSSKRSWVRQKLIKNGSFGNFTDETV